MGGTVLGRSILGVGLFLGAAAAPGPGQAAPAPDHAPRTDGHGDPLPPGALARCGTVRLRHAAPVRTLAFTPDGRTLTAGSADGVSCLWDAATGRLVRRLARPLADTVCAALAPDGPLLASLAHNTITLEEAATGREFRRWDAGAGLPGKVSSLLFSPDGRRLVSVGERAARVWDVATARELHRLPLAEPARAAFSADGGALATWDRGSEIVVWDAEAGRERRRIRLPREEPHAVCLSPDGKALACCGRDGGVRLIRADTGREVFAVLPGQGCAAAAFSPDGRTLATGGWGAVHLWDAATGRLRRRLPREKESALDPGLTSISAHAEGPRPFLGHSGAVHSLAFSPDGKLLASGAGDALASYPEAGDSSIRLWEVATGREVTPVSGHGGGVTAVAVSPDGRTLATGGKDLTIRFWEAATGKELPPIAETSEPAVSLAFSPDGKLLASGDRGTSVGLWEAATGKQIHSFSYLRGLFNVIEPPDRHVAVAFAPNGKVLATGHGRGTAALWDVGSGRRLRDLGARGRPILGVAFSLDGTSVATWGYDGSALWAADSGKLARRLPPLFDPDGDAPWRLTAAAWEEVRANRRRRPVGGDGALSPDGKTWARAPEGVVELWETATGKLRHRFPGHPGRVWHLAFSDDGRVLATAGEDTTAILWEVAGRPWTDPAGPGGLEALWADLGGEDAARAFAAVRALGARPDQAVPWVLRRLRPLAEWPAPEVARWVADLDADDFGVRERAAAGLGRLGRWAEQALRRALADRPSPEARRRLERLLEEAGDGEGPVPTREALRALRALELLEHAGTPAARQALEELGGDRAHPWLRAEAAAALARLRHRSAAASAAQSPVGGRVRR